MRSKIRSLQADTAAAPLRLPPGPPLENFEDPFDPVWKQDQEQYQEQPPSLLPQQRKLRSPAGKGSCMPCEPAGDGLCTSHVPQELAHRRYWLQYCPHCLQHLTNQTTCFAYCHVDLMTAAHSTVKHAFEEAHARFHWTTLRTASQCCMSKLRCCTTPLTAVLPQLYSSAPCFCDDMAAKAYRS